MKLPSKMFVKPEKKTLSVENIKKSVAAVTNSRRKAPSFSYGDERRNFFLLIVTQNDKFLRGEL